MGYRRVVCVVFVGNQFESPNIDREIILKWIMNKWVVGA
jgi:hypothetical protein